MTRRSYAEVLLRLDRALAPQETTRVLGEVPHGAVKYPIQSIVLGRGAPRRALISAGIHGDEPAGVLALMEFVESARFRKYLADWELTLIPCINPHGYEAGTRHNREDRDLNREFKSPAPPLEVTLVQTVFSARFDLSLELHEDIDSPGYYLYQKGQVDEGAYIGGEILKAVEGILPINRDTEIDGLPAEGGVIHHLSDGREMDWWPMAIYSLWKGTRRCLTLETPAAHPIHLRVQAHLAALEEALRLCR